MTPDDWLTALFWGFIGNRVGFWLLAKHNAMTDDWRRRCQLLHQRQQFDRWADQYTRFLAPRWKAYWTWAQQTQAPG